jgi:hypothetical protein
MSAKGQEQTVPNPRGFWPWRRLVCVRGPTQGDLARVYPFGARRIRPGARQGTAWEPGTIGNTDYVAAGVSVKVGVDADAVDSKVAPLMLQCRGDNGTRQLMHFARARGASASVGALFVVSFPLRGQASGKDDWEQPKWTTTSSMFQTV